MANRWFFRCFLIIFLLAALFLSFSFFDFTRRSRAEKEYLSFVLATAEEFSVPCPLILAVIRAESDFREDAVSAAGAVGLMQLMPETFDFVAEELLSEPIDALKITDPADNIRCGTAYLAYLLEKFPITETALAAYNAGEGRVSEWIDANGALTEIPFPETKAYIEKVLAYYEVYSQKFNAHGGYHEKRKRAG